jgi:hypothetical protein
MSDNCTAKMRLCLERILPMNSIVKRMEGLEKRLLPRPLTARHREVLARIEAGKARGRNTRKARGLPADPDWGLPPKKIPTSHGGPLLIDILNEGRQHARLRSLQDEELRQSNPPATGGA